MNNAVAQGHTIPYANSSGSTITAGSVVEVSSGTAGFCGIAIADILDGETGDLALGGVVELAAESGGSTEWAQGAQLYWDGSELTDTPTSNTRIGRAYLAKADGDTTAKVILHPE